MSVHATTKPNPAKHRNRVATRHPVDEFEILAGLELLIEPAEVDPRLSAI